jgi:hypothetical protein
MHRDAAGVDMEVLGDDASAAAVEEWLAIRNALDVRPVSAESFALRRAAEVGAL